MTSSCRQRRHHLGPARGGRRPLRQLAGRQHRLVPESQPVLGYAAERLVCDTCEPPRADLPRRSEPLTGTDRRARSASAARGRHHLRLHRRRLPRDDAAHPRGDRLLVRLGRMPFAQYHYPFENRELFESQFPADFISEGIDQTRGWFYTMLVISHLPVGPQLLQELSGERADPGQARARRCPRPRATPSTPWRSCGRGRSVALVPVDLRPVWTPTRFDSTA